MKRTITLGELADLLLIVPIERLAIEEVGVNLYEVKILDLKAA